jgi:hypothetical protein
MPTNIIQRYTSLLPASFSVDEPTFLWAYACVDSRTFGRFMPMAALVPFADLLNHINVEVFKHTSILIIDAVRMGPIDGLRALLPHPLDCN